MLKAICCFCRNKNENDPPYEARSSGHTSTAKIQLRQVSYVHISQRLHDVYTTSWLLYNVALTSIQRHDVAYTSMQRHYVYIERRVNFEATSWRCTHVNTMLDLSTLIILHLYSQNGLLHTDDKQGQCEINRANMEKSYIGPVFSYRPCWSSAWISSAQMGKTQLCSIWGIWAQFGIIYFFSNTRL